MVCLEGIVCAGIGGGGGGVLRSASHLTFIKPIISSPNLLDLRYAREITLPDSFRRDVSPVRFVSREEKRRRGV